MEAPHKHSASGEHASSQCPFFLILQGLIWRKRVCVSRERTGWLRFFKTMTHLAQQLSQINYIKALSTVFFFTGSLFIVCTHLHTVGYTIVFLTCFFKIWMAKTSSRFHSLSVVIVRLRPEQNCLYWNYVRIIVWILVPSQTDQTHGLSTIHFMIYCTLLCPKYLCSVLDIWCYEIFVTLKKFKTSFSLAHPLKLKWTPCIWCGWLALL